MTFDRGGIGSEQPSRHPIVQRRRDGVRNVVRLTVSDHRFTTDGPGVGVNPQQQDPGHDVVRNERLDGDDARPVPKRMFLRGTRGAGKEFGGRCGHKE